jgi:hypothetical protein
MNKEYIEYKEYMEDADEAKNEASIELTTDEDAPVQSQLKKNLNEDMKQFTAEEHEEGFDSNACDDSLPVYACFLRRRNRNHQPHYRAYYRAHH